MPTMIDRRSILSGLVAGVAAWAFDPGTLSWVTEAEAATRAHLPRVPALDGQLLLDPEALAGAADDLGHIVQRFPVAVLRPKSIDDIQKIVAYGNEHGLQIGVRGAGHSAFGQAQVRAGVVIEMANLATIHAITANAIVVDAGVRWDDVLCRAFALGSRPPALPDLLDHTVGGVLSVGGVTSAAHRAGLAVDSVLELEVVTGKGERLICSPSRHADLFDSALGGLGQHAIIARATLRLVPASPRVRVYTVAYERLSDLLGALTAMADERRFDELRGRIVTAPEGEWGFVLEGAKYWAGAAPPDDEAMLRGLGGGAVDTSRAERDYRGWARRFLATTEHLDLAKLSSLPRPRLSLLFPTIAGESILTDLLDALDPDELAGQPISLVALPRRNELGRGAAGVPDADRCFALTVHRFARSAKTSVEAMLATNRAIFERARDLGATHHGACAIPLTQGDWVEHFGGDYLSFIQRKASYDPRSVLGAGSGIFTR